VTQQPADLHADLAFRAAHVGAGEVAALFDCSPWLTHFELWHRKNGTVATPEFNARNDDGTPVDSRIHWGVKLEALIIAEACERWGYEPVESPQRVSNGKGLGGHPDRVVWCPVRKARVTLEAKTVDWLERKKWGDEPPLQYLLQPNTYAGLGGTPYFDTIAMVLGGGTDIERFQYEFRPKLYAETERRVVAFWESVRAGRPPKPDYSRDGETLAEIYDPTDTIIDLRRDNRMPELMQEFLDAGEARRAAAAREDAAKAEIIEKLGENATALVEGYSCRVPLQGGSPDRVITADMVGQVIKGRAAHRRFYIKERQS
jgi:predicted phage-related endonuclease